MAQFTAPTSQMELDGTPGPLFSAPPPPSNTSFSNCTYLGSIGSGTGPVSGQPCDYWNSINGTGAAGTSFPFTATKPFNHFTVNSFATGGSSSQSFQGGGSKDPNDITQWKWSTSPTPDKDTITNGYAAAYIDPTVGHTILEYGADRFSTSGDANFGAWFFQQNVGPVSGGTFSGAHVDGDIFLISAFTNGGGTSTITVYLWWAKGTSALPGCTASNYSTPSSLPGCAATNLLEVYAGTTVCSTNPTCAITNAGNVTVAWNYVAKSNQFNGANVIPAGALFTGGVDLTFIFQRINEAVPCLSSFLLDTRSSQSPTAVLKDFLGGNFQLCAISASASCAGTPTFTVSPASIHYNVSGTVTNQAAGNLFGLKVAMTVPPAGATNVVITQPVTPPAGLGGGQSAVFSVTFDYPNQGAISMSGNVCGAAFTGGPCTVVNDQTGTPANWSAALGSGTCSISTNPTMSLTKSCVVNLVAGSNGVVLQLADTITVCNTDTKDTINNISISNNVSNVSPATNSIATGLSLAAGKCQTYNPTYTPTGCVNSVLNGANSDPGRCLFQDTASVSSIPTDEFNNPLPPSAIPGAQTAMCHVCPNGVCTGAGIP
jgi:hypothetical protein